MADKRRYKLKIDAYTRDTMPMKRLAEYLNDMAVLFGEENSVHLIEVEDGSTCPVVLVDWEAEPKVRDRLNKVRANEGPQDAMKASKSLDARLVEDNGSADLVGPGDDKIIEFPGAKAPKPIEWPSINQSNTLYGIPIVIGGKNDPVPIHIEDGVEEIKLLADRAIAKRIAEYLFTTILKVFGHGRWRRSAQTSTWELERFVIEDFEPVKTENIDEVLTRLRKVESSWKKLEDPMERLEEIRYGKRR